MVEDLDLLRYRDIFINLVALVADKPERNEQIDDSVDKGSGDQGEIVGPETQNDGNADDGHPNFFGEGLLLVHVAGPAVRASRWGRGAGIGSRGHGA